MNVRLHELRVITLRTMLDRIKELELVLRMLVAVIEQTVEAIDETLEMPREYALSLINAEEVVVSSM